MMKTAFHIILSALLLSGFAFDAGAQGHVRKAMQAAKDQREALNRAQAIREGSEAPQSGE